LYHKIKYSNFIEVIIPQKGYPDNGLAASFSRESCPAGLGSKLRKKILFPLWFSGYLFVTVYNFHHKKG
jgi:hypothetical protein